MRTYKEYADSFEIAFDPGMLDFNTLDSNHVVFTGSKPLNTPGGNLFSHPSIGLIRMIVTDLQLFYDFKRKELSSSVLFAFCKDILISSGDPFIRDWENQLNSDLFVMIKTSGKSTLQPLTPDDPLFGFSFTTITGLMEHVNEFTAKVMSEFSLDENESQPFPELLRLCYDRFTDEQKVAMQALGGIHGSGIVLPLLLVSGVITSVEYVKGLISLRIQPKELFAELLAGVVRVQTYYLWALIEKQLPKKQISSLIAEGEGNLIEFKSTLRWDIRQGKTNSAIERACLKTISAFLNSSGGTLLIGVRDDGSIEGIGTDKFANDDKFLLHLWTLIRTCLGRDISPYIRSRLEIVEEKTICVVDCLPAKRPVFLRQPGFDEELYIRLGPSSNAMDISEALQYIENHFNRH